MYKQTLINGTVIAALQYKRINIMLAHTDCRAGTLQSILYSRIQQFLAANMLVLKYSPDFAISEAHRESQYKFVPHGWLFAIKAVNSLFFII